MVMDKAGSFSKDVHGTPKNSPRMTDSAKPDHSEIPGEPGENDVNVGGDEAASFDSNEGASLPQILDEVDQLLENLSLAGEGEGDPESDPSCIHLLSSQVLTMIADCGKFGAVQENDAAFLDAVGRAAALASKLGKFSSLDSALNEASSALQKAMSFLDEEFRNLLEDAKPVERPDATGMQCNADRCDITDRTQERDDQTDLLADQEDYNQIPPETASKLTVIAKAMISAGYEAECSMAYSVARRSAFRSELDKLGYDGISIDEVQRMSWETLEGEIAKWIAIVKTCSSSLFPFEKNLCKAVFSGESSPIADTLFSNLSRAVVIRLLNFSDAVVLTKRSAEKLFKFLDMYEALRDLENCIDEMASETAAAKTRVGEAAASIFCDLENSIKSETGRTPVPSGAVHPLTRYVMNYLKYACEYKDTLEQVFNDGVGLSNEEEREEHEERSPTTYKTSPFSRQLESVMSLLDANLDAKSKLYRDLSLSYIFLMNNGRYIVQKIKSSTEIHQLMGDTWCRKRSSDLRQYHKNYQRETLGKILQCLGHEGLQVNGKVSKPVLKERFKSFNAMFEEIHKTQSAWVVSDEQLQSELRVSISAVMIPAYRSFLGRFKQYLDSGRQTEKYIKYQPEDIETMIDELFDGNPASMIRRRN